MARQKSIVVAAYGAWEKASSNPAEQILYQLEKQDWGEHKFVPLPVSVVTDQLFETVTTTLKTHRPDYWLGLGVAPGATAIRLEAIGTNWANFEAPDNNGVKLEGEPLLTSCQAAFNASIPNKSIVDAIRAEFIPAQVSYNAGNHMCNQMLYTSCFASEHFETGTKCGFMHVPYSHRSAMDSATGGNIPASMGLETMAQAAKIAVFTLLHTNDQ